MVVLGENASGVVDEFALLYGVLDGGHFVRDGHLLPGGDVVVVVLGHAGHVHGLAAAVVDVHAVEPERLLLVSQKQLHPLV